jgi:hypothetical protein
LAPQPWQLAAAPDAAVLVDCRPTDRTCAFESLTSSEDHWVNHSNTPRSRREFARTVALLAATPLAATAQQPAARKDAPASVADALTEIVRLRYSKHLTAEQLKAIRASIARSQRSADALKQLKLQNGDEPAFVFTA